MKSNLILSLLFFAISTNADAQKIRVPYFGKMTTQKLCGSTTKFCQPTSSKKWSLVSAKMYDGKVNHALSRIFTPKDYFNSSPCTDAIPTDVDVVPGPKHSLTGKVESKSKTNFNINLNSNLSELIRNRFQSLPDSAKNDIVAALKKSIEKESNQDIQLEYQTIDLNQDFIDKQLQSCISNGQLVSTGISILTIKGTWASNTIRQALIDFEAHSDAFKVLTGDVKIDYEKNKNVILNGNFEPISIIFAVAYR